MSAQRQYFEGTTRGLLFTCPDSSTSEEVFETINHEALIENGFELVDDAWMKRCPDCEDKAVAKSNREYDALANVAAELLRMCHNAGPLSEIELPTGEGFAHEGETVFGFWAVGQNTSDVGWAAFVRHARIMVAATGEDLTVNVTNDDRHACIHAPIA